MNTLPTLKEARALLDAIIKAEEFTPKWPLERAAFKRGERVEYHSPLWSLPTHWEPVKYAAEFDAPNFEFRIAQPAIPSGFIPWHGGECPVAGDTKVEVIYAGWPKDKFKRTACTLEWEHNICTSNIIAYRVIAPPWSLPPPPAGQQWHRADFTQDMLSPGWRPLLLDEPTSDQDQWWNGSRWEDGNTNPIARPKTCHTRTKRPLPPSFVPLEAKDVPPGSAMRAPDYSEHCWSAVISIGEDCIFLVDEPQVSFDDLQRNGWLIHRPGTFAPDGSPLFVRCEKEAR